MRTLILYWNEISIPEGSGLSGGDGVLWRNRAIAAFEAILAACKYHPNARISVFKGEFQAVYLDRTLLSWLEEWLGRDRVTWIKGRAIQVEKEAETALDHFGCEVRCNGVAGGGITRAHLMGSWVWSLGNEDTGTNREVIAGEKWSLDEDGELVQGAIEVMNLAERVHSDRWREVITAWGQEVSESCVIGHVEGNCVIMYPLDHGYPHIHVVSPTFGNRTFKYRVNPFECLNSAPHPLDSVLRPWVEQHLPVLMESWRRCSEGKHPLKIDGGA